jgi:hypothetical protein
LEGYRPNPVGVQSDGAIRFSEKSVGYQKVSYTGPDGTETVVMWNCEDGCPVGELDRQSGILHTHPNNGHRDTPKTKTVFGKWLLKDETSYKADSGGASRFFKQVQGEQP